MADSTKEISKKFTISQACRERFLPLKDNDAASLRHRGVELGGVTEAAGAFAIGRPAPSHHLLMLSIAGAGMVRTAHEELRLGPQQAALLPARAPHHYRLAAASWTFLWFHLADEGQWQHLHAERESVELGWRPERLPALMEGCLYEALQVPGHWQPMLRPYCELLAGILGRWLAAPEGRNRQRTAALTALWHEVNRDLRRPWTVGELAAALHVSPVQCHRIVMAVHNCTPMGKVTELRMARARELLRHTDYPLKQIAALVGYRTPYALSKAFKRVVGWSPRAFRQAR